MADWMHLDVLAIAAHPDDVEITCGGLLIQMVKRGRSVGVLDLTQGEKGTLGDENDRAKEAAAAATLMGLTWRGNLALPDSALEHVQPSKLKIAEVIRGTRPELVILPHWEQRHPDHLACSKLGYDACFFAGLKKMELDGVPHRPRKIIYASYYRNTDYSFLVDISDVFDQKCRAVAAYASQFGDPQIAKTVFQPGADIYDLMRVHDGWLGSRVGVQYAEAYTIKEQMLVDDPQKMPVASI
jgi:N-acetylglucosamine malate deacetylase 1